MLIARVKYSSIYAAPRSTMFKHSVKNNEKFTHASGNGNLLRLTCYAKMLVEPSDDGVTAGSHQSSHIKGCTYRSTSSPDSAFTSHSATITVKRSNTYQSSYLSTVQCSHFRQFSQQGGREDRPNPRNTSQQIVLLSPDRASLDALSQFIVDVGQFLFQPLDVGLRYLA